MSGSKKTLRQHEEFSVEASKSKRPQLVRAERYGILNMECHIEVNGKKFEVLNYSAHGVAISTDRGESFLQGDRITVSFFLQNIMIQQLELRVVYKELINESIYKVALEITGQALNIEKISGSMEGVTVINHLFESAEEISKIESDYKSSVYDIQELLDQLRRDLIELENSWKMQAPVLRKSLELGVATVVSQNLDFHLKSTLNKIEVQLSKLDDKSKKAHLTFFRSKLENLIYGAPMAYRAYYKPNGYAGDFEMMNLMYRDDLEGAGLFEKCIHKYFVMQGAAKAVRSRNDYLLAKIEEEIASRSHSEPVRILSVACGPAYEIERLITSWSSAKPCIQIVLLDQDLKALQYAQQRIRAVMTGKDLPNVEVQFRHMAIKNIIVNGMPDSNYNMIYSAGLFDYFTDGVAIAAMKQLYNALSSGGRLLIGNFDIANPSRGIMEIILDWHLIYRSKEEFVALAQNITDKIKVESEAERINLFVQLEKSVSHVK